MAERAAAQHCAELLRGVQAPVDLEAACAEFGADLAQALPAQLSRLLIGPPIEVADWHGRPDTLKEVIREHAAPSVHYAIAFSPQCPVFVASFGNGLALALTDRMFGGRGAAVEPAPRELPQSAALSVERVVSAISQVLAPLCHAQQAAPSISSNTALRRLGLFWRHDRAFVWTFTLAQAGHEPWDLQLAVPEMALHALLQSRGGSAPKTSDTAAADPLAGAMAAIPLPLTAMLAELSVPLARLADLRPGDCIPLSPRRDVPLMIGNRVIATGTVGAFDERTALRLTRLT